ncbi:GldG family protein [Ruminiclostridium hungatei]|uniref:GldG family protein n=1 Tax=Ruminiclostridium hungatei TaxID=48256 RepID=UPI001F60912D|nr:GldG family protein [Ruminiclostridium hungatei]
MGKFKLNRRSLKYGSNSIILIVAVLAIAVIVNLLVGMGDIKWDLTSDKLYTLGDESKTIIKDIKKEVTIYGLFDDGEVGAGSIAKDITNLLAQYEKLGIKVTYVDPDKDPGTIASFDKDKTKGIKKYDFVVKSGNKIKKLSMESLYGQESDYGRMYTAEPLITGAIKFVTSDVTPVAYFVEGHDEYSVDTDLTRIKADLENNNLEVKPLSLLTGEKIPEDCKLLVFASPKRDLSEAELIKVNAYLKGNTGRVIFLFDPVESGSKFPNFEQVLQTYNIGINYDKVKEMDESRHLPGDEYSFVGKVQSNDINNSDTYDVFLPDSRSLSILKNDKEWLKTYSMIKTTEKAEALSILNQGSTEQGPFDIAIATEVEGGSKVLVFGNGIFITDVALSSQYSNQFAAGEYYFLKTIVNWMQDKEDQTTISSKLVTPKTITVSQSQAKGISIVMMGVLPVLIMACGLVVWARRRHL